MNLRDIRRLGKHWQSRLGLAAWDIQYHTGDLRDEEADATCAATPARHAALITIQRGAKNAEYLIVHELLHCVWPDTCVRQDAASQLQYEQAIDITAEALTR